MHCLQRDCNRQKLTQIDASTQVNLYSLITYNIDTKKGRRFLPSLLDVYWFCNPVVVLSFGCVSDSASIAVSLSKLIIGINRSKSLSA